MSGPRESPLSGPPGPGTRLGRYVLEASIGVGGMASVFRARADDGAAVAVKILHPATVLPEDKRRFDREFETLARLDHPNVVRVIEAGLTASYPWIAMELVDGPDLGALVDGWPVPRGPERLAEAERVVRELCAGLAYIHARGLIHRDLKPQNVLIAADGRPKLSDFGVVKDPDAVGTALTRAGRLVGTVAFMAPEQITSDAVDARADLYSLGAVLFLLLTGRRPIEAKSIAGYLARHLAEVPPAPHDVNPEVPPRLSLVCQRLLAKDPAERFQSAMAVLEALDRPEGEDRPPLRARDALLAEAGRYARLVARDGAVAHVALVGPPGSGRTAALDAIAAASESVGLPTRRGLGAPPELPGWEGDALAVLIDEADRVSPEAARALDRDLLARASREGLPLLLVTASASRRTALSELGAGSGVEPEVLALQPLDREDVIGMMRDRGVVGPAAPVLGRRLHHTFAGLPGPIAQQLDALVAAGWLRAEAGRLKAACPLDVLREAELPVPESVGVRLRVALERLDPVARRAAEVMASFGRPIGEELLAHALGDDAAAIGAVRLVERGLVVRGELDGKVRLRFAHPSAAVVVRAEMAPELRRRRAAEAAAGLARRRRRADALELASLYAAAGDAVAAYPCYVRAARRAAREARYPEVVRIVEQARGVQPAAEAALSVEERIRQRRWLYLLEGEAQLARGRWDEALRPLENAVAAARLEGEAEALAQALSSHGRAHYRRGDFAAAEPLLAEALRVFAPTDPARAAATRALGDIHLRRGELPAAEALWGDALAAARASGDPDAEARALRGLANVHALRGELDRAATVLEQALDRLDRGGDPPVRCGVLSRAVELDVAAARYGSAMHRTERMLELVQQHELVDRIADAWALRALALLEIGRADEAIDAARQALTYAQVQGRAAWGTRLRAARALLAVGRPDLAAEALPAPDQLPRGPVEDPGAQLAALRARLLAPTDPSAARDLALWALTRPEPLLVLRAFRIKVDAARALAAIGAVEAAREAAKRALRLLDRPGTEGFRLDGLLALHQASPDPRVAAAATQLAARVAARLPPSAQATFLCRADLAAIGACPR